MIAKLAWSLFASAFADCSGDLCNDFSLLQRQLALEPESESLPSLTLIGRSFYSSNPSASAKYMERYFSGEVVENPGDLVALPGSVSAGAFLKSRTAYGDYNMFFARGDSSDQLMDDFVEECQKDFDAQTSPTVRGWSHWGDLHDGLADYGFNLSNAAADGMAFFRTDSVTRMYLEGTAYTFELKSNAYGSFPVESASDQAYLDEHTWFLDEPCREDPAIEAHLAMANGGINNHLWWKSTFAVVNAYEAEQFAMDVLGATDTYCPFPYPPNSTCTGALWAKAAPQNDTNWELHFVEMSDSEGHEVAVKFHDHHAQQAAALKKGCMKDSLYDNIAFSVSTLDPFVQKLEKAKTPYLAMKTSGGRYAVIFAFPGNEGVVVQLQSDTLTQVKAKDLDEVKRACASL